MTFVVGFCLCHFHCVIIGLMQAGDAFLSLYLSDCSFSYLFCYSYTVVHLRYQSASWIISESIGVHLDKNPDCWHSCLGTTFLELLTHKVFWVDNKGPFTIDVNQKGRRGSPKSWCQLRYKFFMHLLQQMHYLTNIYPILGFFRLWYWYWITVYVWFK